MLASMPAKNTIKEFVTNGYYHLYNRGVEKRDIFMDEQDYGVMTSYMKTYLTSKDEDGLRRVILDESSSYKQKADASRLLRLNNFVNTLQLLSFCLMPNHFHFLVKQTEANTIDRFMNSLFTRYSMYINRRYKRVGPLFQGLYKAVLVTTEEQFLYLSRYIHRNPASKGSALRSYPYSSYAAYLGLRQYDWLHPKEILSYFGKGRRTSYQSFVEDIAENFAMHTLLVPLMVDE